MASATWLATTFGLVLLDVIHENRGGMVLILSPVLSTMVLGAVSNALEVKFIPDRLRAWWQTGIRERLWNSKLGAWLARRLGAPERSRAVGPGAFRATEAALGVAGITVNNNAIPFDTNPPTVASGIRIVTPAVTTRGMGEAEMDRVADLISAALKHPEDSMALAKVRAEVEALCQEFPLYPLQG